MGLSLAFRRQGLKVFHWGLQVQGLVRPEVVVEVLVLGELGAHWVKKSHMHLNQITPPPSIPVC